MKIAYYCQHVLGVGHFHRSLEICRACSTSHEVTMIIGGPEIDIGDEPFTFLKLPGLVMDDTFSRLMTCDPALTLEEVKELRKNRLLSFFSATEPDCLMLELYPFGRKAFRFELTPLLNAAQTTSCRVLCSLRDILVEKKTDHDIYEHRAVDTLNGYFDSLLVHADPRVVTLDTTFGLTNQIEVPLHYTGFVTPRPATNARNRIRSAASVGQEDKLIVVSIGSGSVGTHLLEAVARARRLLKETDNLSFRVFTGPYCDSAVYRKLASEASENMVVTRFTDNFVDWLAAADLSISMAGYNTTMNVLAAGVPALMLPFDQNREQRLRVERLAREHPIRMLSEEELTDERLEQIIAEQLNFSRYQSSVDLDGAAKTCSIAEAGKL